MIFNTSKEIAEITGTYYANNNFTKLYPFLYSSYLELSKQIGSDTMKLAEAAYTKVDRTDDESELLRMIQRPLALKATLELYRHNDISHKDSGRVWNIDNEHEKMPWQWQLQRDDEITLNDYYQSLDDLMTYLEAKKIDAWLVQKTRLGIKQLLISNSEEFSQYWPINSPRIFLELVPFIKETQRRWLIPAMTMTKFETALTAAQNGSECDYLEQACNALVLHTMGLAFKRGLYSIIPEGVVQRTLEPSGLMRGESLSYKDICSYAKYLELESDAILDDMKVIINGTQNYDILPTNNDPNNKYMML